jgi:hypothetical protein
MVFRRRPRARLTSSLLNAALPFFTRTTRLWRSSQGERRTRSGAERPARIGFSLSETPPNPSSGAPLHAALHPGRASAPASGPPGLPVMASCRRDHPPGGEQAREKAVGRGKAVAVSKSQVDAPGTLLKCGRGPEPEPDTRSGSLFAAAGCHRAGAPAGVIPSRDRPSPR